MIEFVTDWSVIGSGYTRADKCPEIVAGCRRIADLISSMTIHLMENKPNGDVRIVNNLSRKIDIEPCELMTRKQWMDFIIMNLLLYGKGNSVVVPVTKNGNLISLTPIPAEKVNFYQNENSYDVKIGEAIYSPDEVLHFVHNPDPSYPWKGQGVLVPIKMLLKNLNQAAKTKNEFMSSKFQPSLIVKVNGLVQEFASQKGREKLLKEYIETGTAGQPWMIPADLIDVDQVKPLSLSDLAINDAVELDQRTVAAILGVPPFVLGNGDYNSEEWNNFINSTIRPLAKEIEQELSRKLIISEKWYLKFNITSLYEYDFKTLAMTYGQLYNRGIVTGNEVRDKLGLSPIEGLDELVVLENYIPQSKIGDQKKLKGD